MNKIIFTLLITIFSSVAFSQNYSNLTIGTTSGPNLKVRFAGKQYTLQDSKATFQVLTPGTYTLQIYQLQNKNNGQEYVEVYNNNVTLTAYKHTEVMVMRFGKIVWDEGDIKKDDWNENYQNPSGNDHRGRSDRGVDDDQFQKIKTAVENTSSDYKKLETVQAIFKNNMMSSEQLKSIMHLFSSDYNKLDYAKFAYDYCTDKGSYFTLADEFASSFNKSELMAFIKSK